ncbi:organic cation transporter protein-like [Dendronephthya gigantea]|uniref:organic cation transporter protein-like n=1 Tax=Dendronephthya gigantea TaxID=151771 RepID=UPI0010690D7C|nr:organic cation transporter protein-like [Dendronephthya gigantea]XP_028401284.1 organic cation transporter protein-like [Dendronephthya gigantea]XP_028401285.1 organic cation transporter protein-like [Dendronephthya gigantea]
MAHTIDDVIKKIGEFRQYQWYILGLIGYTMFSIIAFASMIVSFITAEPDWKCVEGYKNNTVCGFNNTITLTSDDYEARCKMPREAWTFVDDFTSAVTEYDLVCDDSILLSIAQSCFWIGMLVSFLIGGFLSDKFGRRLVWYGGCALVVVTTWIMIFPNAFLVFIVCRVFIGIGLGFVNCTFFPLLVEFTTERYRSWMGAGSYVFWGVGISILPLIGFLVPEWRMFLLVTAIFAIPALFLSWLVPESPRWLLLNGKEEEAKKVLAKMARMNKRQLPDVVLEKPLTTETRMSFRQLFSSSKTSKKTLIFWNIVFANALVYYGVFYNSVDLGGNRYLNFFLVSVIEIPSNFIFLWSADRFGRKKCVLVTMVLAFIASAISVSIPVNQSSGSIVGRVTAAITAKFFINISFSGIYLWCVELYPTVIRSTALSTASSVGSIGAFFSTYIAWLIRIHAALPYSIMGIICLQAALLGLFLPETKGTPTKETMNDMETMNDTRVPCVNNNAYENEAAL